MGKRQLFVRFGGCHLTCQWCDQPEALTAQKIARVETEPGKHHFEQVNNPVSTEQILIYLEKIRGPGKLTMSVSITGGEPLLQVNFHKELFPALKKDGYEIYLETAGVFPDRLEEVIEHIDISALDIKLPSSTGMEPRWEEHEKTLQVASLKETFVKVVCTHDTKPVEVLKAAEIVANVGSKIPLVLQPVTPFGPVKRRPTPDQMLSFQAVASRYLSDVRVIPQMHKIMGAL